MTIQHEIPTLIFRAIMLLRGQFPSCSAQPWDQFFPPFMGSTPYLPCYLFRDASGLRLGCITLLILLSNWRGYTISSFFSGARPLPDKVNFALMPTTQIQLGLSLRLCLQKNASNICQQWRKCIKTNGGPLVFEYTKPDCALSDSLIRTVILQF